MQQSILPQVPANPSQPEAGGQKAVGRKETGGGSSQYESVSRAEQKRLDQKRLDQKRLEQKQADRQRQPDTAGKSPSPEKNREPTETRQAQQSKGETEQKGRVAAAESAESEVSQDALAVGSVPGDSPEGPVTFASLRSLFAPIEPPAPGVPVAGLYPGTLQGLSATGGTVMAPALAANMEATPARESRLTTMLAGTLQGEASPAADRGSLLMTGSLPSPVEAGAQQQARMNLDPGMPLRGYTMSVDTPVGQAEWGDKVMGKLSWLTARNMSMAEIHLTPPDMGPMEVKVRMQNDQATVTVHAANPVVREQLELNSHRLRDMLGEQGLSLAQFDVSDQPGQQSGGESGGAEDGQPSSAGGSALAEHDEGGDGLAAGQLDLSWRGEVDIFA